MESQNALKELLNKVPKVVKDRILEYFSIVYAGMTVSNKSRGVTEMIMKNLDQALQHLESSPNNEVALTGNQGKDKETYILERLATGLPKHDRLGLYFEFPTEFGKPHRLYYTITAKPFKVNITRVEEYS